MIMEQLQVAAFRSLVREEIIVPRCSHTRACGYRVTFKVRKLIVGIAEGCGSGAALSRSAKPMTNSGRGTVVPTTGPKFRRMSAFARDSIPHQKDSHITPSCLSGQTATWLQMR
jgi:hypothetical protein